MHKPPNNTGLTRIINAAKFSLQGFLSTYDSEEAFRQECYAGIVMIPLSFWIASTLIEWLLMITSFLLILVVELLNSAIEAAIDRFGGSHHELSGKAKDAGSAAVSVAILITAIIWFSILLT